jgi:hypothetical protein
MRYDMWQNSTRHSPPHLRGKQAKLQRHGRKQQVPKPRTPGWVGGRNCACMQIGQIAGRLFHVFQGNPSP